MLCSLAPMARRAAAHSRVVVPATLLAFAGLTALAVALGPAGCALFIPDDQLGTDCHFAGAGSACGQCVATHCQESVNACCASSACASTLASLESCTQGAGCTQLAASSEPLPQCVQAACIGPCSLATTGDAATPTGDAATPGRDAATAQDSSATSNGPDSATTGSDSATVGSDAATEGDAAGWACAVTAGSNCICVQSSTATSIACDENTFGDKPNTVCYMQPNGQCECDHMGCHNTGTAGYCTCSLPDTNPADPTCDQTGLTCCVAGSSECDCSAQGGGCSPDPQVDTCTVGALAQEFPPDYTFVTSCSSP